MPIKITLQADFTAANIMKYINNLTRSPWSIKRRKDYSGFELRHRRCGGHIKIRTTKPLRSSNRIVNTVICKRDAAKLTSEFIEWIFTHFGNKIIRIVISP